MNPVVERILYLVDKCELNEKQILNELDISNASTITDWRTGKSQSPSIKNIIKFAQFFNVSTDYLLTGKANYDNISEDEQSWLSLYKELSLCNSEIQNECIGYIKGCIKGYQLSEKKSVSE